MEVIHTSDSLTPTRHMGTLVAEKKMEGGTARGAGRPILQGHYHHSYLETKVLTR